MPNDGIWADFAARYGSAPGLGRLRAHLNVGSVKDSHHSAEQIGVSAILRQYPLAFFVRRFLGQAEQRLQLFPYVCIFCHSSSIHYVGAKSEESTSGGMEAII